MKKIRLGLIGLGGMGGHHYGSHISNPDVELVAVCDIIPEKVENCLKNWADRGCETKGFTDFKEMIDTMELDAVEKLYNRIVETGADLTLCTWNQFDDRTGKIDRNHVYAKLKQVPEELDDGFNWRDIKTSVFWQTSVPWDKMYKRDFLIGKNVMFPGGTFFEDNAFVYDALFKAEKMSVLREDLIYYRINRRNAVTNSKNKTFFDYLGIFNLIGENLKKVGLFEEMKGFYWDYKIITLYWWFMKIRLPYKKRFFDMMKEDFKNLEITEEDKKLVRNRTLFLLDRVTKLPFFVYYPLFYFFDKIYRVEKGVYNYTEIWFSTYEKWHEYKKEEPKVEETTCEQEVVEENCSETCVENNEQGCEQTVDTQTCEAQQCEENCCENVEQQTEQVTEEAVEV